MKKRVAVIIAVVTLFAVTVHAQTVYQKDRWGAKLYYIQEHSIRQKDRWGEPLLWYDAAKQQVRQKDRWGEPLLYIDGQTVRQKDRWGAPLLYFDGQTIRQKDRWGAPLYYLDGQTLRQKDRWGDAVYYFDFEPTMWQIACIILDRIDIIESFHHSFGDKPMVRILLNIQKVGHFHNFFFTCKRSPDAISVRLWMETVLFHKMRSPLYRFPAVT